MASVIIRNDNSVTSGDTVSSSGTQRTPVIRRWRGSWQLYLKTFALCISWICLGLYSEILGPTLPSLRKQTGTNTEQMGQALSVRSVGLFIGSVGGGILADALLARRCGIIACALLLASIVTFCMPFCINFWTLSLTLFFAGCAHGAHTTNGNPLLGALWAEKAAGPFNLMHAGYGLGASFAPLILSPFTIPLNTTTAQSDIISHAMAMKGNQTESLVQMHGPYSIVAALLLLTALLFAFLDIHQLCRTSSSRSEYSITVLEPSIPDSGHAPSCNLPQNTSKVTQSEKDEVTLVNHQTLILRLRLFIRNLLQTQRRVFILIPTVLIMYLILVGNERVFGKFMFMYATEGPIGLPSADGYLVNLCYWVTFCIARIVTVFFALKCSCYTLFALQLIGTLGMTFGLSFAPYTWNYFLAFSILFGFFKSPLFPTALSIINRGSEVSGLLVFVVNLGSAVGATALQSITGSLLQHLGVHVFPYIVMVSAAVLLCIGFALIITVRCLGDRFENAEEQPSRTSQSETMDNEEPHNLNT